MWGKPNRSWDGLPHCWHILRTASCSFMFSSSYSILTVHRAKAFHCVQTSMTKKALFVDFKFFRGQINRWRSFFVHSANHMTERVTLMYSDWSPSPILAIRSLHEITTSEGIQISRNGDNSVMNMDFIFSSSLACKSNFYSYHKVATSQSITILHNSVLSVISFWSWGDWRKLEEPTLLWVRKRICHHFKH